MQLIESFEAASSPCFARSMASNSVVLCFGSVKSPFSGRCWFRCGFELFSLYKFAEAVADALSTVVEPSEYQKP